MVLGREVRDCRESHGAPDPVLAWGRWDRIARGRGVGGADGPEQLVVPLVPVLIGFPGEDDAQNHSEDDANDEEEYGKSRAE
jgi:hypothetical protein